MACSTVIGASATPGISERRCRQRNSWRRLLCCDRPAALLSPLQVNGTNAEPVNKSNRGIIFCRRSSQKNAGRRPASKESEEERDLIRFSPRTREPECIDCHQTFASDLALYQHCRMQHATSFVDARCCDAQIYTIAAFAAHAEAKHAGQHVCIRCREFFDSVEVLEQHLTKHGAHRQVCALFCILCGACRHSDPEIRSHFLAVHHLNDDEVARFICRVPLTREKKPSSDTRRDGEARVTSIRREQPSLLPCISVANISDCLLSSLWNC
ncbi:hypothetical protein BIW11_07103 [Tropilaelaps mercedesae]|uniref:C2H2-type domain-containing protein n=1 Tax=Tropilaelaps mercedesae TaxID=418985 RepID=A0A1V9XVH7_9ACAR|nr:hypothetical protein BIW11_07103 [Tropilaelaps mercedesae]